MFMENYSKKGKEIMQKKEKRSLKRMALIAMLGALSGVLMLFKLNIPFMPPFYTLDVGDLPALFGGFLMGPVAGLFIILLKLLIKLVQQGSDSLLVGELSNFVCSVSFVLPAAIIYRKNRSKTGAVRGMIAGGIIMTVVGMISNAYVMLPLYAAVYGLSMDKIVDMCHALNPAIDSVASLIMFGTLPFNVLKAAVVSVLTFLVYKKAAVALRRLLEE